jgi:alpha-mannosidase
VLAKKNPDLTLENEHLKMVFDGQGAPISIMDKRTNKELLKGSARSIIIDESEHDTWSHGRNYFNKEIGSFTTVAVEKLESNDMRETVKVTSTYGDSTMTQWYVLRTGEEFVRVRVRLNWNEKHKLLKLAYPVACQQPTSIYEIPFGTVERPCNGEEEPALMWAMIGDENSGLAILNDCKYSYSATDNELALTAIRSPIYCDHGLTRGVESNYTDQGIHEFSYGLLPATVNEKAKIFRKALAFNTAPTVILENHHQGVLPLSYEGICVDKENIVVSAVKQSEDGTGYVVRAYECDGKATETKIDCKQLGVIETAFTPYEVKTFFIDLDKNAKEVLFTEYTE